MKTNQWKNNGDIENPIYDFLQKNENTQKLENKTIIREITAGNTEKFPWIREINKIPYTLKTILIAELEFSNSITSINNSKWPQDGSIVVKLKNRFRQESKNIDGTKWKLLNDPHYCNEEISEIENNIEFLLIN